MADDGTKFAWDEEKGDWKQVEGDEEEELEEEEEEVSGRGSLVPSTMMMIMLLLLLLCRSPLVLVLSIGGCRGFFLL